MHKVEFVISKQPNVNVQKSFVFPTNVLLFQFGDAAHDALKLTFTLNRCALTPSLAGSVSLRTSESLLIHF